MTYAQILAGGVSFQLYNKSTNAVVPTSVSDGGGYIEITEDATSDHNTIYKIDQFVGAVSEITLYTEGDSAKTYALLGASQNEDVVAIRLFTQAIEWQGGEVNVVYAEVNGKLYVPYVEDNGDWKRLNAVSPGIETVEDDNINGFPMLFPKTKVEIVETATPGCIDSIKFLQFNDTTANISGANAVVYKDSYDGDEPWRFGQDGWFQAAEVVIRINGKWYLVANETNALEVSEYGTYVNESTDGVYSVANPTLAMDYALGDPIELAIQRLREVNGIEISGTIKVTRQDQAEVISPFEG